MTSHFKNMLYLFAANAVGCSVKTEGELNIEEIRRLSAEQGIWTLVYPELAKICDARKYQPEFFKRVSTGIVKKEFTLNIIKKLEEAGIECCLLKGASVSHLYKDPECRISGDTDILINPKDEKKANELLASLGYAVEERAKHDHHTKAEHPVGGLLEVHIALYGEATAKFIFNGKDMYNETWRKMKIGNYEYNVLGINDGLMYLTAHYIKHLVNEGGGVRQMMDLLLYIEAYKDEIDFERYNKILRELKYDKLVNVVKTVGAKYFGFDYEIEDEELAEQILSDSEIGGIFGFASDERKRFYDAYCNRRTSSDYNYKAFSFLKGHRNIVNKFFPSRAMLVNIYGYKYAKNKLLIPVAWINRYFDIIFKRRRVVEDKRNTKAFQSRMQLMRDLGMIE